MPCRRFDTALSGVRPTGKERSFGLFKGRPRPHGSVRIKQCRGVAPPASATSNEAITALLHALVESSTQQTDLLLEEKRRAQQADVHAAILSRPQHEASRTLNELIEFLGRIGTLATGDDLLDTNATLNYAQQCIQAHDMRVDELRVPTGERGVQFQHGTPLPAEVVGSLHRAAVRIEELLNQPYVR